MIVICGHGNAFPIKRPKCTLMSSQTPLMSSLIYCQNTLWKQAEVNETCLPWKHTLNSHMNANHGKKTWTISSLLELWSYLRYILTMHSASMNSRSTALIRVVLICQIFWSFSFFTYFRFSMETFLKTSMIFEVPLKSLRNVNDAIVKWPWVHVTICYVNLGRNISIIFEVHSKASRSLFCQRIPDHLFAREFRVLLLFLYASFFKECCYKNTIVPRYSADFTPC